MEIVTTWTALSCLIALAALWGTFRFGRAFRDRPMDGSGWDPFTDATRVAFHRDITPTGRVRLMLALLAEREADAAGAARNPAGLHRATL